MSYRPIEALGAFMILLFKGFKGKFKDHMENNFSFLIGFLIIILIVLILTYVVD